MSLCKIDIEENSKCKKCCKDCNTFLNQKNCKYESKCIIAKRHMECKHQITEKNKIVNKLMSKFDFKIDCELDGDYYLKNNKVLIALIFPHEGTYFKCLLRADYIKSFDKWSNCEFEEYFEENNFDILLQKLNKFINKLQKEV